MIFCCGGSYHRARNFTDTTAHRHVSQNIKFELGYIAVSLLNVNSQSVSWGTFLRILLNESGSGFLHKSTGTLKVHFCLCCSEGLNIHTVCERAGYNYKTVFQFAVIIAVDQNLFILRPDSFIGQLLKILKFFCFDQCVCIHCQEFLTGRCSVDGCIEMYVVQYSVSEFLDIHEITPLYKARWRQQTKRILLLLHLMADQPV